MTARDDRFEAFRRLNASMFENAKRDDDGNLWFPYRELSNVCESYAAARVAEATAELRSELERTRGWNERVSVCRDHVAEIVDGECIVCQRDELQRRVAELEVNDRRYRFLRDTADTIEGMAPAVLMSTEHVDIDMSECVGFIFNEELDSTIDAILADREGGKA